MTDRELGPDVSGGPALCPLCGSRMLQAPSGDTNRDWCPDDGYVPAERPRTLRRFDYAVGWAGRRAMQGTFADSFGEQGTKAGGS